MNRAPSRRDVLRLAGATGATLLAGCGDNSAPRGADSEHAACILEPEADSFLVAVWSPVARSVLVEVTSGGELVRMMRSDLDAASRAAIVIDGLAAATSYEVHIVTDDGAELGPCQVRTAPAADDPRPVRIAISADLDQSPEFDTDVLDQVAATAPDIYLSIGDFPYTDNGPPAMTVDEYRARHAQLRTAPRVRRFLQAVGVRAIYDDHEFRNDWDAHWVAVEPDRYAAAMQVWDEFFPLRDPVPEIRYRRFHYGANVECFLLDCRRFRSADAAPDDATKTMLGTTQLAWLLDGLTSSTAAFKLVLTSIPLDFGGGDDHWASFTTERQVIFDAIAKARTPGVLFVSGDQHFFAAYQHAYGLREFQIGPVARGFGTPRPLQPGILFTHVDYNVGLFDFDGDQLVVSGVGPGGQVFYQETLTAAQLTPSLPLRSR
jgi:alkaline phosphatase D